MKRGRKPVVDRDVVIEFALANPSIIHTAIAEIFDTTQWTVGEILRAAGIKSIQRGRQGKRRPGISDVEYEWEQTLHNHGLGMSRGTRLGGKAIFYGYDPKKADVGDASITNNPIVNA